MQWVVRFFAVLVLMTAHGGLLFAEELGQKHLNFGSLLSYEKPIYLAQNESRGFPPPKYEETPFEEPFMDGDKLHGYLGAASFLAVIIAGATAPDYDNPAMRGQPISRGTHHYAGIAAAVLGGAAIISGFAQHSEDIEPNALDPDTMHMTFALLSTAAYAYAISRAPKRWGMGSKNHAAAGIAGAGMMAFALYLEF